MIRNYFLTAFRNILRYKFFSTIIVIGLTIGIAIFGLVLTYVDYEHSYDKFNFHYNSIYRLEHEDWALLGTAYGPEIGRTFPEVDKSVRVSVMEGNEVTVKINNELTMLDNLIYADSAFFDIFSFTFLSGNPEYSLSTSNAIVLTESTSRILFGNADPINKTLQINNNLVYTVTGVIKDVSRFHIKISAVASFISLKQMYNNEEFLNKHDAWNYYTYLLLKDHTDPEKLADKITAFYAAQEINSNPGKFSLRPLKEIYFTLVKYDMPATKANKPMLYMFLLVAVFILIIACVNFINLAVAKASTRSKEIGTRKVAGAGRFHLISQFLGESVLYAFIATELSLVLMEILRPVFNGLVGRPLTFLSLSWGWILFLMLVIPLIVGILAGIYPALYLTRFSPIVALKKEKTRGKGSLTFRYMLIILQFVISTILIIGTLTVAKQMKYFKTMDLGYSKDNILILNMTPEVQSHLQVFRQKILDYPNVEGIAFCTQSMDNISWQEAVPIDTGFKQFTYLGVDTGYLALMNVKMAEGSSFNNGQSMFEGKVLINKSAVAYFDLKSPATGQFIGSGDRKFEVMGVTEDFHYNSLHEPIAPMIISLRNGWLNTINVKISNNNISETIKYIETVWGQFCPGIIFKYRFLDESYEKLYTSEALLGKTFSYLAILAIFIACIGLFGLSSFLAQQRIKEIGVRKALGETTTGIVFLFSKEFGKWVLLAAIAAIPIAWFIMNKWLNTFAFHVKMDIWIMAAACLLVLLVAVFTLVLHTRRIAARNPVEALRYE